MSEGIKKILKKMKKNAQFLAHFPLSAEGNRGEKKVQKSENTPTVKWSYFFSWC